MSWEQAIATLVVVPMLIFFYVAFSLNEKHIVLRMFFFIFGLGMLGIGLMYAQYLIVGNIAGVVGERISLALTLLYTTVWMILMPYFLIYFIITIFKFLQGTLEKNNDGSKSWKIFDI